MPRSARWPILVLMLAVPPAGGLAQPAGGTMHEAAEVVPEASGATWRDRAASRDIDRLGALSAAWAEALEAARGDGRLPDVAAEGVLLDSRSGQDGAQPEPGIYRCRTLRLGAAAGTPALSAYPAYRCRVSVQGDLTVFEKLSGSQRIGGVVFLDTPRRSVLIGTEATATENGYPRYGDDPQRDRIAVVERLGPNHWRLVFPRPPHGPILEVLELTRVSAAPAPPSSPAPARSGTSRRG